jgi:hypothetical protein
MKPIPPLNFTDNPAISGREEKFITVTVAIEPVLASWQSSLFSHEWLTPEGSIKKRESLTPALQEKYDQAAALIQRNAPLTKPVLGIGIMDNIEIGSSKDLFMVLATQGTQTIPVHIPKSHLDYFRVFIKAPSGIE